jgi:hypothetical protein
MDEKPYKLADSGNMFLLVHPNGSRCPAAPLPVSGQEKTFALGSILKSPLSEARERARCGEKADSWGMTRANRSRIKEMCPVLF